jgi:hypothetical protein
MKALLAYAETEFMLPSYRSIRVRERSRKARGSALVTAGAGKRTKPRS